MTRRAICFSCLLAGTLLVFDRVPRVIAGENGMCREPQASVAGTVPPEPPVGPGTGLCHVIERGQTLYSIARAYGVPLDTLASTNRIPDPARVEAGRVLFIPGATEPRLVSVPAQMALSWPLRGLVTSPFGSEGHREHHAGIDIDGVPGQIVRAAAGGRVVWAGEERGYGNLVIIEHSDHLSTVYAHASRLLVGPDEWVESGEPVAEVGDTGNARGTHLHFEVRLDGRPVNPLPLLGESIARSVAGAH